MFRTFRRNADFTKLRDDGNRFLKGKRMPMYVRNDRENDGGGGGGIKKTSKSN